VKPEETGTDPGRLREGDGREVIAGFRPEAFSWPEEQDGDRPRLRGRVETVELLGHEQILYLDTSLEMLPPSGTGPPEGGAGKGESAETLAVRLPVTRPPETGEEIELAVDSSQVYLFREDGQALEG